MQYFLADLVINSATRPFLMAFANRLSGSHEDLALMVYRKIYKSLEREGIRVELAQQITGLRIEDPQR